MKTFSNKNWPKEDENAVAYALNFVSMAYGYDNDIHEDYFKSCCDKCKSVFIHYKDFEIPKASIKKPYFQLDWYFYGVSEDLKNRIIEYGIDDKENDVFRPIWTRKHDKPIGYSIEPKHILNDTIFKENNHDLIVKCSAHDILWSKTKDDDFEARKAYNGLPVFVSENVLKDIHDFNYTKEFYGPGGYLVRSVIVSKRMADFIIQLYPHAEFRPVIIGKR